MASAVSAPSTAIRERLPRAVRSTCARPSMTASVPSHGCSGRNDGRSAISVAARGASNAIRPGALSVAWMLIVASAWPARCERNIAVALMLSSWNCTCASSAVSAQRQVIGRGGQAFAAEQIAAFAPHMDDAIESWRCGDRPVAGDHQRGGEGQSHPGDAQQRGERDAAERTARRELARVPAQVAQVGPAFCDPQFRGTDMQLVACPFDHRRRLQLHGAMRRDCRARRADPAHENAVVPRSWNPPVKRAWPSTPSPDSATSTM